MTKVEKEEWNELYEYVKNDILGYTDLKLPKIMILRLKGLREGKFIANKRTKPMASYPYNVILMTFKVNKYLITSSISNRDKFKDEKHMVNYIMAIVESKINDTYLRMKKVEKVKEQSEKLEINTENNKSAYKKRTKDVKNSRLKDLM